MLVTKLTAGLIALFIIAFVVFVVASISKDAREVDRMRKSANELLRPNAKPKPNARVK